MSYDPALEPGDPLPWVCDWLIAHVNGRTPAASVSVPGDAILGQNGEPPLAIDLDVWAGAHAADRSSGLWAIAGELAAAGANEETIVEALRERDVTLGWLKFANRRDAETRYRETARRQLANAMPRIQLRPDMIVDPDDDDAATLGPVPDVPLSVLPELLRHLIQASSLPVPLLTGAYLGAIAAAAGGNVHALHDTFYERLILFIALVAATGSGKSPALRQAWNPLEQWDDERFATYRQEMDAWQAMTPRARQQAIANGQALPHDATVLFKIATPEAVYRRLDKQPALGLLYDELASFLKGLSRYRKNGDDDTDAALTLWEGAPLRYTRVGQGGSGGNAVDLFIPTPTITLCGGIQTARQGLLGVDLEGLRPRWLPFPFEGVPAGAIRSPDEADVYRYGEVVGYLLEQREARREWLINAPAWRYLNERGEDWLRRGRDTEMTPSALAAIPKATRVTVRLALAIGEFERAEQEGSRVPARDQTLTRSLLERAACLVDYSLDAWQSIHDGLPFAIHPRIERIDQVIERWIEYLQRRGGGPLNLDLLRNNKVGGVSTKAELDAVAKRYEERFPKTITDARQGPTLGRKRREIRLPIRKNGTTP